MSGESVSTPEALAAIAEKWTNPPAESVHQLPREVKSRDGGKRTIYLDYMGHAEVTLALIDADPCYQYGWSTDDHGNMDILKSAQNYVLNGWLELHGVRRPCVATVPLVKYRNAKGEPVGPSDPEKELIGDLLRNGAMRFGIATGLWSKSEKSGVSTDTTETAEAPDDEAMAVFNRIKTLSHDTREVMKEWATGRGWRWPIMPPALQATPELRSEAVAWLDEHTQETTP